MARTKKTVRTNEDVQEEHRQETSYPTEESILPSRLWLDMKNNNTTINLDSYACKFPVFLSIIKHHPWRDILANHPRVPKVYLQQFWRLLMYKAKTQDLAEYLECHLGECQVDLDVHQLRNVLSLPYYRSFEPFPDDNELIKYIEELGYSGSLESITLNWDLIPPPWQFLLQLMVHNLTAKERGKDYASRRTLIMWIAFIFNKKYDIAQLIFDEIRENMGKRDHYFKEIAKKEAVEFNPRSTQTPKEIKKPYIPFQRFFQTIVARIIDDPGSPLNPRSGDHQYPEFLAPKFKNRANAILEMGMPIPDHLLDRVPGDDVNVLKYRKSLTLTRQSEPIVSTPGVIAPTQREGLDLGKSGDDENVMDVDNADKGNDEVGGEGENVDVQTPVHTPVIIIASPSGAYEGGVEKDVSEGERKKYGDKKKRKRASSDTKSRHRGTKSTILSRLSTEDIEKDVDSPSTQTADTPPLHSLSPLDNVSKRTGTSPHLLISTPSEPDIIEKESQDSRLSTSFVHESSSPHVDIIRTSQDIPISLRDDSGTVVGRSQSERFQGSTGNPSTVNITPTVREGPSSDVFVPSPDKATSNLRDLGLPSWASELSKLPIPTGKVIGKGKATAVDDPISRIRYHYDIIEERRKEKNRPMPVPESTQQLKTSANQAPPSSTVTPVTSPVKVVISPKKQTLKEKEKAGDHTKKPKKTKKKFTLSPISEKDASDIPISETVATRSDYDVVKALLQTLPRQLIEEVHLTMALESEPYTLRDATIIDAISLPRNYEPTSFEDILKCEQEEILTVVSKYRAHATRCRMDAEGSLKRKHSDDDPDDHPNEGETERLKKVKLETVAETTKGGEKESNEEIVELEGKDSEFEKDSEGEIEKEIEKKKENEYENVKIDDVDIEFRKAVIGRIKESRVYNLENIEKMKPKRYEFEERLKQSDVKILMEDDREKERQRLQNEHLELYKFALTNEFGVPKYEKIDRKMQRKWHKRLNLPFMEDIVKDFFVEKPKEIESAILFGLTNKEKTLWSEFKHFIHFERQGSPQVHSPHGITNVRKIGAKYHNGIKYPTFVVQRTDGKVYKFSEADFKDLNSDDIEWFFNNMKRWENKKPDDRYAESCIKRFMEGQVKEAMNFDFQIALESGQGKVNLTQPKRVFPVKHIRLWTIVNINGKGIIYTSPHWEGNIVMLFDEVHHFSTGTLRLVLKEIQEIIRRGDEHAIEKAKWKFERKEYEFGKDAIEDCLSRRKVIQRYEMCLKIRENKYSILATVRAQQRFEFQKEQEECAKLYPDFKEKEKTTSPTQE